MSSVRWRLERLEQKMGGGSRCVHGFRVLYPPEDWRPPSCSEVCPACGMTRATFRVVYDEPQEAAKLD